MTNLIENEIKLVDALIDTIARERHALRENNISELSEITKKKHDLFIDLEKFTKEHFDIMQKSGFAPTQEGTFSFIKTLGGGSTHAKQIFESLLDKLKICQEENMINGSIISINLRNSHQLLEIIYDRPSNAKTYSAQGDLKSTKNTHELTKI